MSGQINYINPSAASLSSTDEFILKTLKGHTKSLTALEVAFANTDCPIILSGSHDGLIVHWNSQTGKMDSISSSSSVAQHKNKVQAIRFDTSSDSIVTCGFDDVVKFIDLKELKYV